MASSINLGMENWFIVRMEDAIKDILYPLHLTTQWGSILYGRSSNTLAVPSLGLFLLLSHRFSSALIGHFHQTLSAYFVPDPPHPTFSLSSPFFSHPGYLSLQPSPPARGPGDRRESR